MEALKLENINKTYQDGDEILSVLKDINLTVKKGEIVAIVGPSGSGKSTFLSISGALLHPTNGKVSIGGEELTSLTNLSALRLNKIGFIFQNSELIPYLSVIDQLNFISKISHTSNYETKNLNLLKLVGLENQKDKFPSQLSGGQKQRVAIARSIVNNPSLILADEPTASLDFKRGYDIVKLLRNISHELQKTVVLVTHDERVLELVDKVYAIKDSALIQKTE